MTKRNNYLYLTRKQGIKKYINYCMHIKLTFLRLYNNREFIFIELDNATEETVQTYSEIFEAMPILRTPKKTL